jgi:hypothetical protein
MTQKFNTTVTSIADTKYIPTQNITLTRARERGGAHTHTHTRVRARKTESMKQGTD